MIHTRWLNRPTGLRALTYQPRHPTAGRVQVQIQRERVTPYAANLYRVSAVFLDDPARPPQPVGAEPDLLAALAVARRYAAEVERYGDAAHPHLELAK